MPRHLAAVVLVVVMTLVAEAAAQPGNTPAAPPMYVSPPATVASGERSPGVAMALSLGGTAASIGALALASKTDSDALGTAGALGLFLAPSFGHWYAGDGWTTGMTLRLAGTGATLVGGLMAFACFTGDGECSEGPIVVLVYGGMGMFVAGGVYDIATAPGAARTYNARLRERAANGWAIAPVVTGDRAGLVLGGRF